MTSKRRTNAPTPAPTTIILRDLAERWLAYIQAEGKAQATVRVYRLELGKACGFLCGDTPLADLTPDAVAAFFQSDLVTRTVAGAPKAAMTVQLSRRVLRLALSWAEDEGLIDCAPLPDIR